MNVPAAFAGCYGFKPSFGRVPMHPPSPNASVAHTGPLTNTVRDAALVMNVIAGPNDRDRLSLPAIERFRVSMQTATQRSVPISARISPINSSMSATRSPRSSTRMMARS